jgi:hypothetical protein
MNKETFYILFRLKLGLQDSKILQVLESGEEPKITLNDEHTDEEGNEFGHGESDEKEKVGEERKELTTRELKEIVGEVRGVMDKGKTLVGKEVLDLDMSLDWTKSLLFTLTQSHLPKSLTKLTLHSLPEGTFPSNP